MLLYLFSLTRAAEIDAQSITEIYNEVLQLRKEVRELKALIKTKQTNALSPDRRGSFRYSRNDELPSNVISPDRHSSFSYSRNDELPSDVINPERRKIVSLNLESNKKCKGKEILPGDRCPNP